MTHSAKTPHPEHDCKPLAVDDAAGHEDFEDDLLHEIPHLRNYAISLTRDAADAGDLVQDAVLRALEKRDRFIPGSEMRRWLFTILRNRFLDGWRKRSRRGHHVPIEDCPSHGLGQPASQDDWMELKECEESLSRMRAVDRAILLLSVFSALSNRDIARRLGVAEGTVRSRLSRTRADLRA
ncbi:RNA polymerase sigma factor [Roseicyclus sp.]